jgi:histidinol dehydrogenase
MKIATNRWSELDSVARDALLERPSVADDDSIRTTTAAIIAKVRAGRDTALRELTLQFDGADISDLRVSKAEIEAAIAQLSPEQLAAIDLAIDNVRRFHEQQRPTAIKVETMPGVVCERVSHALDAVGLYVPAGTAPLPSAAIMLAVPAAIAGCPTRILCTPPQSNGQADAAVLAAASRAGVTDIYKVGGAQAIAAMAYGTESIPKVCKVFGPGNAWVTSAKTLVSIDAHGAAIDMPAGPSEIMVIADDSASVEFVASDLLSQAEHGSDSQVVLVTTSASLAENVGVALQAQLADLSRAEIVSLALDHSRIFLVDDLDTAVAVSNQYAPEHLILQIREPRKVLPQIRNAGSVFLGPWTPESVGDYCSGTNHVLPTYGFARTYSGLGVDQFMRQMTIQELSREGLEGISSAVISLAGMEGLDAHAAAVTIRLKEPA